MEDEPGASVVETALEKGGALIPHVALLEVRYITLQEKGLDTADYRHALLLGSPAEVLWTIDEPTLLTAARLKATHRISLGDSIVAAYAIQRGATLLHKDPEFEALTNELKLESLPYKRP
jgi:ribonuclease VapC